MITLDKKIILIGLVAIALVAAAGVFMLNNTSDDNSNNGSDGSDDGAGGSTIRASDLINEIELTGWYYGGATPSLIGEPSNESSSTTDMFGKVGGTITDQFRIALYVFDTVEEAQNAFSTKKAKATTATDISGTFDQFFRYYPSATHTYVFQYMNVYGWVDYAINLNSTELNALFANIEEVLQDNLA